MKKLSLIIPCYNEEKTLQTIVEKASALGNSILLELIIVDDCSKDNSFQVAQQLLRQYPDIVRVVRHERNM